MFLACHLIRPLAGKQKKTRHFSSRPTPAFVQSVQKHVNETGLPETFPGLHPGPISKSEPFHILCHIEINSKCRPLGDLAPCPMCHARNKFRDGRLVYLFEIKAVAIIGHCCADADRNRDAVREWEIRQSRIREEDYLLENLPRIAEWCDVLKRAKPPLVAADLLFRKWRTDGKQYYDVLRHIKRTGGELVITEVIAANDTGPRGFSRGGSEFDTRDIRMGSLLGQTALRTRYDPIKDLISIEESVGAHVQPGEDEAFAYLTEMTDDQRKAAYEALRKASNRFEKLLRDLEDFREFFTKTNFHRINRWAAHRDAPLHFSAQLNDADNDGKRRLLISTKGVGLFHYLIPSTFWAPTDDLLLPDFHAEKLRDAA